MSRPLVEIKTLRQVVGWPREKPCLVCDRPHLATSPGDRTHPECRERALKVYGTAEDRGVMRR